MSTHVVHAAVTAVCSPSQQVFGTDARVEAGTWHKMEVSITCNGTTVATVAQRDLFRKYQWPAEPKVRELLEMYKEEMTSDE